MLPAMLGNFYNSTQGRSVFEHFDDSKPTSFADVTRLLSHEPIYPKGSLSVKIEGGSCL